MHTFQCMICSIWQQCWWLHASCSASLWRSPSTDVTKGVNVPRLSSTALYIASSFLEPLSPKLIMLFGVGVMVRLCQWLLYQTTLPPEESKHLECLRSALNPGADALESASLTIGSRTTSLHTWAAISPRKFRTSLCRWMTRPPVLQSNAGMLQCEIQARTQVFK